MRTVRVWLVLLFVLILLILWFILATLMGWFPFRPEYPAAEFFIQDQVVVTGPEAEVTAAVGRVSAEVQLRQLERLSLAGLGPGIVGCPGTVLTDPDTVIDLYHIEGSDPDVAAAVRALNDSGGGQVRAEPNWLAGSPWSIEGSPWSIEGSPWSIEGSATAGLAPDAMSALFMEQWAFANIDLPPASDRPTGAGVRVGVFDTSPFTDVAAGGSANKPIGWVIQPAPLTLNVFHPVPVATPEPTDDHLDVGSHGLFAAGLVHAVAPGSAIHLIRVLQNDNRGDLFTLNRAIYNFVSDTTLEPASLGAVINLSLGIRMPPEAAGFDLPPTILSLQTLLEGARCLGVVTVAAAGNDSAGMDPPAPAHRPGDLPAVLGVAASNVMNRRGCFANAGDIAAPGGDGRGVNDDRQSECRPRFSDCQGDCQFAVIGPAYDPAADAGGYTYWTGSSFAAPLVSGLAAVVMEAGRGQLSPAEVEAIIMCGATRTAEPYLGPGVINVRQTLEQCLVVSR